MVASSVLSDRLYYDKWTFPPLRFLYFNIVQSLAVFYGTNRPDYYLTEGLPLLLTTALPFAVVGLWQTLRGSITLPSQPGQEFGSRIILRRLAWASLTMTCFLSLIAHKEVRFLYPVLPFLHVLAARPLSTFFPPRASLPRRALLTVILTLNLLLAAYASLVHQRGVVDVLSYLRQHHEEKLITHLRPNTTVAFLMPCHSTPWRSHLIYPSLHAWALTCEPPIDMPPSVRPAYLDEADQFYLHPGPMGWLDEHMESVETIRAGGSRSARHWGRVDPGVKREGRRPWPEQLVFFAQLESTMRGYLEGSRYEECWRGFNSQWHDDRRRNGDVVVWCLK